MVRTILLSRNFESYRSGYYHQDLVNAILKQTNCYIYGPGYENYDSDDDFNDVIGKSPFAINEIDLIICSTSWDDDKDSNNVDPHPKINLSNYDGFKKVYFLNKEYKKLKQRFSYCKANKFDHVFTVHPDAKRWSKTECIDVKQLHFGIDLSRFLYDGQKKDIDFAFTGSLHSSHLDYRKKVKKELFFDDCMRYKSNKEWKCILKNVIKPEYRRYKLYWAEFGARGVFGQSLLPFNQKYGQFLKRTKVFLNTPSAVGIFNTRFFELMASQTLILCPDVENYSDILENEKNCLMYKPDMSNFREVLGNAINDNNLRQEIVFNANIEVKTHSYESRVNEMLSYVLNKNK